MVNSRKPITSIKPRISTIDTRVGSPAAVERIRGREHDRIRQRILVRDGAACVKCGCGLNLEIDHVVPLARGGQEGDVNRQALCVGCHALKTLNEEKERGM
jgi:5-methylcytosine-specific restriction protein A